MFAIITAPTVSYKAKILHKDEIRDIDNPIDAPGAEIVDHWMESIVSATIITPSEYVKGIISLCEEKRGIMT
jgi:translation elongation factor EF-4